MWKDSYRIGVEQIDLQHIELFQMVEKLLKMIEDDRAGERKEEYKAAIGFMKDYVVRHFHDEEIYQESIHYSDIENHKKEHRDFTQTVLDYEKQFIETDYAIEPVKKFAGKLVAWLIYHVAGADQRIAGKAGENQEDHTALYAQYFLNGIAQVFETMFDVKSDNSNVEDKSDSLPGNVFVKIGLGGGVKGDVIFGFPKELALRMMKIMTFMELEDLDEVVCSAVAEVANIISGNAATELAGTYEACNITTPEVTLGAFPVDLAGNKRMHVVSADTEIGTLSFTVV